MLDGPDTAPRGWGREQAITLAFHVTRAVPAAGSDWSRLQADYDREMAKDQIRDTLEVIHPLSV